MIGQESVAFVVYDAGETLALLPVAARLAEVDVPVDWVPLTPWAADLLNDRDGTYLELPQGAAQMPHARDRFASTNTSYWEEKLLRDRPGVAVLGMVSEAQGQIARRFGEVGIPTRGFHDGFQQPGSGSVAASTVRAFDGIWVPTTTVQKGFSALGVETVVVGQPSLEAWRRASVEVDADAIRTRQGLGPDDRILLFAGQYGPGYNEVLGSFLDAIRGPLARDSTLVLVVSHHPRTDGALERAALSDAGLPRAAMAQEGLSTMELAVAAEVVLTWMSTVGIQAAFMGRPVVYYSPPPTFQAELVGLGAASLAHEANLGRVLNEVLRNPMSPAAIRDTLVAGGFVVDADRVVAERIRAILGVG
jgi:hypothetical protein